MGYRTGVTLLALAAAFATPAFAKKLPGVQMTPSNQPPQCATPGRMMAFLRTRNPRLAAKFDKIAVDYMRQGRDLVETNSLKFTGDVRPRQNNFAGLGATGKGVRGESFRSVADGVRAHQQHLMIYAGIRVDDPVADRTRKVQAWGILDKWRKRYRRAITFSDVGKKWAPYDRGYAKDIETMARAFYSRHCDEPDPRPDLLAEATGSQERQQQAAAQRRRPPVYDQDRRTSLGATNVMPSVGYRTLNADAGDRTGSNTPADALPGKKKDERTAAKFATPSLQPEETHKCRVWTASYGGQKATIIRSVADSTVNYTVLDINTGREDLEAKAYIAAYAKGGSRIGDFPSKSAAMEKAFKLCPKG
jgi:hypothetical protein